MTHTVILTQLQLDLICLHGHQFIMWLIAIYRYEGTATTLLCKNIFLFYSFKRGQIPVVYEREGRITSSLDQTTLYYDQVPTYISSASRLGLLNRKPVRVSTPPTTGALSDSKLDLNHIASNWLQLTWTLTQRLHLSIHNTHDFR